MSVSLKQIAAQTNVSIATVSKVLSGREDVSDKTRLRVLKVARELSYRPNLLVRGMQTGRTQSIGLMVPSGDNPFFTNIVHGVHDFLQQQDYVPILLWASRRSDKTWVCRTELEVIQQLVDRRVDGLIVSPIEDDASDDYLHEIHDHQLPMVAVDRVLPNSLKADFVGTDDFHGGVVAAEHLLGLGHRHILHFAGPEFASTGRDRRKGFESVIRKCANVRYDVVVDPTFAGDPACIQAYFSEHPKLPTAIFAANDYIAMRLYSGITQRKLRVGADVAIIGFADLPFTEFLQPTLTTIRQNPIDIGRKAAQLVLNRIQNTSTSDPDSYSPVQIRLKPELIIRESTAK